MGFGDSAALINFESCRINKMSITRMHGKPKIGSAGDTPPAPRSTISTVPETIPPKPPSVMIATRMPMISMGLVKLIGTNCTVGPAIDAVRLDPQRLQ